MLFEIDQIKVEKRGFLNLFGDMALIRFEIEKFFLQIGDNPEEQARIAAQKIENLAGSLLKASGREVGWIHLQAWTYTSEYDIPRWHMDGLYFRTPENFLPYKFVATLKGPSTLFYPADATLRKIATDYRGDREYLQEIFPLTHTFIPPIGDGVLFIGSDWNRAAIHSEPVIHEERLFFSIIPCEREQLAELKPRIEKIYQCLYR